MNLNFLLATVFGLAVPAVCFAKEIVIEATGELRCTTFEADGTNSYSSKFHVAVSGCNTLIRSKLLVDEPDMDTDYLEYACQGSNSTILARYRDDILVTNVTSDNAGVLTTVTLKKPQRPWNQATLLVSPTPLPPYGFEALTVVWLAYGSRCHYGKTGQDRVAPVVFIGDKFRESGLTTESQWVIEKKRPGFLKFMAEFSDGNTYDVQRPKIEVKPLPPPFDSGFTNAIFRTIEWTNVAGFTLPRRFELLSFNPDFSSKTGKKLRVVCMMVGETHSFNLNSTRTNFVSELPERYRTHYFEEYIARPPKGVRKR